MSTSGHQESVSGAVVTLHSKLWRHSLCYILWVRNGLIGHPISEEKIVSNMQYDANITKRLALTRSTMRS